MKTIETSAHIFPGFYIIVHKYEKKNYYIHITYIKY